KTEEEGKRETARGLARLLGALSFLILYLLLSFFRVFRVFRGFSSSLSPGEVGEGPVGLGHLDGVLALGHGLALPAEGGHEFVGQAQEHRPAGLVAGGADDPADR